MKKSARDVSVGIIAILLGLLLSVRSLGVERTLILLMVAAIGPLVLRLWRGGSTLGRVVAAILLPAVLMQFWLPKSLRSAVKGMKRKS